ncbi:MAG: hypothetical protein G3W60_21825, partial [Xanthomonas perforans]|nr:hypothetical protein [Xanthomonas perforans]
GKVGATVLETGGLATVVARGLAAFLRRLPEILAVILAPVLTVIGPVAILAGIVLAVLTLGPILAILPILAEVLPRLTAVVVLPVALEALASVVPVPA